MATNEVVLQPKSWWQKDNCIGSWLAPPCTNPSTQEAFIKSSDGIRTLYIRCCTDPRCVKRAIDLARDISNI